MFYVSLLHQLELRQFPGEALTADNLVSVLTLTLKVMRQGTSLVVQWLRICLATQGAEVQSLVGGLRSHTPGSK